MTIIVDFVLPPESFAPGRALRMVPEMHVVFERLVPSGEHGFPYFWASNGDFEVFERAARAEPAIASLTVVEEIDHARLYRAEWSDDVPGIVTALREADAAVLDAVGTVVGWRFQLRFSGRADLDRFRKYCTDHDVPLDVIRLTRMDRADVTQWYGLTERQHTILQAALVSGYFDDPRTEDLGGLGGELGISSRAASRLLNRGLRALLEGTIGVRPTYVVGGVPEEEPDDGDVSRETETA